MLRIEQGDVLESVRIVRVGETVEAFRPTAQSSRARVSAAEARITEHAALRADAERGWIAER